MSKLYCIFVVNLESPLFIMKNNCHYHGRYQSKSFLMRDNFSGQRPTINWGVTRIWDMRERGLPELDRSPPLHGALHCLSLFSSPDQCLVREGDLCNNRNGNIMTMVLVILLLFKGGCGKFYKDMPNIFLWKLEIKCV